VRRVGGLQASQLLEGGDGALLVACAQLGAALGVEHFDVVGQRGAGVLGGLQRGLAVAGVDEVVDQHQMRPRLGRVELHGSTQQFVDLGDIGADGLFRLAAQVLHAVGEAVEACCEFIGRIQHRRTGGIG